MATPDGTPKYGENEPLSIIVETLEKANYDSLAEQIIDVFAKNSTELEQLNLIAKLYLDVRANDKAVEYSQKVLTMCKSPEEMYNCRANLGKLFNNINEPEKSMFHSKLNLMVRPDNPDTLLEMVFSYYLLNKKDEAEKILRDLKSKEDQLSEHHRDIVNFNLGTYDLEQGKFIEGMKGFMLKGQKLKLWFGYEDLPYPFWNGQKPLYNGQPLILHASSGGIGDSFISIRFYKDLVDFGFTPIYFTERKDLYEIFNRCGYKTIMKKEEIPADSWYSNFMQVPIWLNSSPDNLLRGKYLYPSEEARQKWAYIKENKKLKIGVRYSGQIKNERNLMRQIKLSNIMEYLKETLKDYEVEYYSLQIGDLVEELLEFPEIIDVSDKIKSYDDTFALLENLDYVVTTCTSVLHASAIMGTKTLAVIPISAYFTWVSKNSEGRPENTSIWYEDNLRIFFQKTPKQWDEPLTEAMEYLLNDIKSNKE